MSQGPGGSESSEGVTAATFRPVPDLAADLGVVVTRVHQMLRDRSLVGIRVDGVLCVPGEFVADGAVVKGLPATITLLTDAGYDDAEIIDWLFRADDTLPGTPIGALRANRGREVHRRAQAAGF